MTWPEVSIWILFRKDDVVVLGNCLDEGANDARVCSFWDAPVVAALASPVYKGGGEISQLDSCRYGADAGLLSMLV